MEPASSYLIPTMAVTVTKVSVAIGQEELEWARGRAKREGRSLSAVLTDAMRRAKEAEVEEARRDAAWAELKAWVLDGKPLTVEELEAARRELDEE